MSPEPKLLSALLSALPAVGDASVPADSLPTFSLTLMTGLVVATPGMPRIIRDTGCPSQLTRALAMFMPCATLAVAETEL
jgi:hypothetical protein